MALPPRDLKRLVQLAELMSSDQLGERAAAALKCTEFLARFGLRWADVLMPPSSPPAPIAQPQPPPPPPGPRTWRVVAEEALLYHYGALHPDSEPKFLTDILHRGFAPTPKQSAWLLKICRRCGVPPWNDVANGTVPW